MTPDPTLATPQLLTDQDLYLFNEGSNYRMHDKMGAHLVSHNGEAGTVFSVWAPNARSVSVVGSFNGWDSKTHRLGARGSSGIWEGFAPGVNKGALYKFHIESHSKGYRVDKADPLGLLHEKPPRTASVVWDLDYQWSDDDWMQKRAARNSLRAPQSIYEVHLGSWMRVPEDHNRPLTYRETAPRLAEYVRPDGIHSRRVPARDGAPFLRFLGIPDHRLLRAHVPLRHAAGLHVPGRLPAPARHRRDSRLGARRTSLPTPTASPTSTARISTSTPTRARDSIPTGRRTFSIMAAPKCAAS